MITFEFFYQLEKLQLYIIKNLINEIEIKNAFQAIIGGKSLRNPLNLAL